MYYPIDENAARAAKRAISFSDYEEGSATAEYRRMVDDAEGIAERQKQRVDPMYHDKIDGLLDAYCRRLAENMNAENRNVARVPSILVAGGSNFPVRAKEKQNARSDALRAEFNEIQGLLGRITSTGTGGISAVDPRALDKLRDKLSRLEAKQDRMKKVNAAIRLKDTAKGDARLAELGYTAAEIAELREPDYLGRPGFPAYELTNNNANIRRTRERIAELEKRQSAPAPEGWEFDGGTVIMNTTDNRLQVLFDDVPDADIRAELKSNGFKWSPKNKAWQRQLTGNAINAAKRIKALAPGEKEGENDEN